MKYQDLNSFRMPVGFRGRGVFFVQFWWLIQSTFFRWSPQVAYGFRRWLLRCFGAKVGVNVIVRPSATFTYPWKISIGDRAWIGDDVVFYSLGNIVIGDDSVVSQKSYLCGGDHDYLDSSFPIRSADILIGNEVWIAADVFVAPGVEIGSGTVVAARSSVFTDLPGGMICRGSPCRPVRSRSMSQ